MKNTLFIYNIIKAILILMLLVFVFIKNEQLYLRLLIFSFMLLVICYIAKNICSLLNKPKSVNFFHKLFIAIFIIMAIVFLVIWSYAVINNKQYFYIVFTLPFWLFIISIIRKCLGISSETKLSKRKKEINFKRGVFVFLVASVIVVGIICLTLGIKDMYYTYEKTKNYLVTTAYYDNYEIYDVYEKDFTYRLIYVYEVNGNKYSIKTDYGSGFISEVNRERQIKYNPNNPSEAIFLGTNKNSLLIFFGIFFFFGGMVFVLGILYTLGVFDKIRINIMGLYIGIVFFIVGVGIIGLQLGETSSFLGVVKQMNFWIIVPLMFIIVGIFQVGKCLFWERLETSSCKKNNLKKKLVKKE